MELLGAHQVLGYRPPHALLTCLMVALLPQRQMASASQLAVLVKLLADFSHHPGSRTLHLSSFITLTPSAP
ncbi:hypothetical protein HaLaN_08194 [Haematococcus lacustris]|uniref:Uncharacterized protein n=1 Tax=Haematococcus lacustris TaxID=44745 RepID=A0A699YRL4_HAELA|nr:hypothetical protein HaLaN_08194 [Haematococcus lacustris]